MPRWYTVVDWITRMIISIVIPIIVIAVVMHESPIRIIEALLTLLSKQQC
jgi:hypothetical protein